MSKPIEYAISSSNVISPFWAGIFLECKVKLQGTYEVLQRQWEYRIHRFISTIRLGSKSTPS